MVQSQLLRGPDTVHANDKGVDVRAVRGLAAPPAVTMGTFAGGGDPKAGWFKILLDQGNACIHVAFGSGGPSAMNRNAVPDRLDCSGRLSSVE